MASNLVQLFWILEALYVKILNTFYQKDQEIK